MKLAPAHAVKLRELYASLGHPDADAYALEKHGLAETGRGRFGPWARITAAGKRHHEATRHIAPEATAGLAAEIDPSAAGSLLRGAAPRPRRNAANQAPGVAAPDISVTSPPTDALHSGVLDSSPDIQSGDIPRLMRELKEKVINGS